MAWTRFHSFCGVAVFQEATFSVGRGEKGHYVVADRVEAETVKWAGVEGRKSGKGQAEMEGGEG
eukprot:3832139-Rhodomonas_salina.2